MPHTNPWAQAAADARDTDEYRQCQEDEREQRDRKAHAAERAAEEGSTAYGAMESQGPPVVELQPRMHPVPAPAPTSNDVAAATRHRREVVSNAATLQRMTQPCSACHAAPGEACRNYKGQRCHPHGVRKPQAGADARDTARARDLTAAAIMAATCDTVEIIRATHEAPKPEAPAGAGAMLAEIISQMLDKYDAGEIIDATWAASHARFSPGTQKPQKAGRKAS